MKTNFHLCGLLLCALALASCDGQKNNLEPLPADDGIFTLSDVAKILLLRGEIPMAQIASECGFRSASYFTTAFKDYTGLTPSDFVAQNRL